MDVAAIDKSFEGKVPGYLATLSEADKNSTRKLHIREMMANLDKDIDMYEVSLTRMKNKKSDLSALLVTL